MGVAALAIYMGTWVAELVQLTVLPTGPSFVLFCLLSLFSTPPCLGGSSASAPPSPSPKRRLPKAAQGATPPPKMLKTIPTHRQGI